MGGRQVVCLWVLEWGGYSTLLEKILKSQSLTSILKKSENSLDSGLYTMRQQLQVHDLRRWQGSTTQSKLVSVQLVEPLNSDSGGLLIERLVQPRFFILNTQSPLSRVPAKLTGSPVSSSNQGDNLRAARQSWNFKRRGLSIIPNLIRCSHP